MKRIEIIGNIGREPKERVASSGNRFYEFSVAVNESSENATWFSCIMHGESKVVEYLTKGRCVFVRGGFTLQVFNGQPSVTINVRDLQLCGSGKMDTSNVIDRKEEEVF